MDAVTAAVGYVFVISHSHLFFAYLCLVVCPGFSIFVATTTTPHLLFFFFN